MRILTLCVISLWCWGIWLSEVLIHGWDGLIWISYFHVAVPISFFFVTGWLSFAIQNTLPMRLKSMGIMFGYAAVMYLAYDYCLVWYFISGPSGVMHYFDPNYHIKSALIYPLLILTPVSFHYVVGFTTTKTSHFRIAFSTALFAASPVIGLILLMLTTRYDDYIHVIKSGSAIVPMILSLCFPYAIKTHQPHQPNPSSLGGGPQ